MKNLLLALLGTTMLSAASAQCDSLSYEFTSGSWDGEITCTLIVGEDTLDLVPGTTGTLCLEYDVEYPLILEDSFGDGWNGAQLLINDQVIEIASGVNLEETVLVITVPCSDLLAEANATIDALNAQVAQLQDALDYAVADGDTCFTEYSALDDQFTAAVFQYEAIIDSLNAIISAVPASIEVAADNAYAQGLEDCAEAANEACLELLNEAYDGGVADGISYMEDEVLPQLLVQEYDLGYNAGLADCEGEVAGIVDIDGTVINVIGYYNQLGQVIDPATATGVIIRKHEDGTFSKYFR